MDNLRHLLPDRPYLRARGICSLLDLIRAALGERNSEHADQVVIGSFNSDISLNERLPFADERAEFVGGEV